MKVNPKNEDEYEDLLGLWSDLESALSITLSHPNHVEEFVQRIMQYDLWMCDLLKQDTDTGLYLLFQLAGKTTTGYSASHALVCAVLCHLVATEFDLPKPERDALVQAALTMNLAMTAVQDELAIQKAAPSDDQLKVINEHPEKTTAMLQSLGLRQALLLDTIRLHHRPDKPDKPLDQLAPADRLSHLLLVIDRYAAMISPRSNREGRNAAESIKLTLQTVSFHGDQVGNALVRMVGLSPPGTLVKLDDGSAAMVRKRGQITNFPDVVIVLDHRGQGLRPLKLHRTSQGAPSIKAALSPNAIQDRLNHHSILRLGA